MQVLGLRRRVFAFLETSELLDSSKPELLNFHLLKSEPRGTSG
jgi:hypothetical protein